MNVTSDPTDDKPSILPMGMQVLSQAKAPWEQLSETQGAQPVVLATAVSAGFSAPAVPILKAMVFISLFHRSHTFSRLEVTAKQDRT